MKGGLVAGELDEAGGAVDVALVADVGKQLYAEAVRMPLLSYEWFAGADVPLRHRRAFSYQACALAKDEHGRRPAIRSQEGVLDLIEREFLVGQREVQPALEDIDAARGRDTSIGRRQGPVVRLEVLDDVEAVMSDERNQIAQGRDLVIPHVRSIIDDDVERTVLEGEPNEFLDVGSIEQFNRSPDGFETFGGWIDVGADDPGAREVFLPGLE